MEPLELVLQDVRHGLAETFPDVPGHGHARLPVRGLWRGGQDVQREEVPRYLVESLPTPAQPPAQHAGSPCLGTQGLCLSLASWCDTFRPASSSSSCPALTPSQPIRLSFHLPALPVAIGPSTYPPSVHPSTRPLSLHLSVCPSTCTLSLHPSVRPSTHPLSLHLSICPSVLPPTRCLCIRPSSRPLSVQLPLSSQSSLHATS